MEISIKVGTATAIFKNKAAFTDFITAHCRKDETGRLFVGHGDALYFTYDPLSESDTAKIPPSILKRITKLKITRK